jgi:hypothetical protein
VVRHKASSRGYGLSNNEEDTEPIPEPRSSVGIRPHAQHSSVPRIPTPIAEQIIDSTETLSADGVRSLPTMAKSSSVLSVPTLNSTLKLQQKVAEAERNKAAAAAAAATAMQAQMTAEMQRLEVAGRAAAGGSPEHQSYHGLVPIADPADAASAAAAGNVVVLVPRRVGKQVDARWQASLRDPPSFEALHRPVPPPAYRSVPPLPRPDLGPSFSLAAPHRPGDGGGLAGSGFPGNLQLLDAGAADIFAPAAFRPTPDDWW